MVVVLHLLWHGGILASVNTLSTKYVVLWLIESLAFCAVNCFALVSGYVYFGSKYRFTSVIQLYLQVALYSVGIAAVTWMLKPEFFSVSNLLDVLFPVSKGAYWYVSCYVGLFLFIPLLNAGMNTLSRGGIRAVLILAFIMFSVIPTLFGKDAFGVNEGFSTLWLVFLYMIGAYIKKYDVGRRVTSRKAFWVYAICVLASWGIKMGCEFFTARYKGVASEVIGLIKYPSPTMVCAAVFLFLCFKNATIPARLQKGIAFFAPAAFGVYLIHDHEYVRAGVITGTFAFLTSYSIPVMVAGVLLSAFLIFSVCLLVDRVRVTVFQKLHVKEKIDQLEQKYLKFEF